jgi:hypothetical protein
MRSTSLIPTLLVAATLAGTAFAQQVPLLDAVELVDPALTKSLPYQVPGGCPGPSLNWACAPGPNHDFEVLGADAAGSVYAVTGAEYLDDGCGGRYRWRLNRTGPDGTVHELARLHISGWLPPPCTGDFRFAYPALKIDLVHGALLIGVSGSPSIGAPPWEGGVIRIDGLPKLFDTLLTFIPGQQAMNILTPAHPDGFRSADSLQVWTGNVRSMPDWSQAEALTCAAAVSPAPGQIVSVPDTLPDPVVGEGRYYLVASQSGADRRLGRQYVDGAFSARTPAGLPVCQ